MVNICIGPVCIPIEAIIPFLLMLLQPMANWYKKMRGIKSKDEESSSRKKEAEAINGSNQCFHDASEGARQRKTPLPTGVQHVESEEQWQKIVAVAEQKSLPVIVKFTAKW